MYFVLIYRVLSAFSVFCFCRVTFGPLANVAEKSRGLLSFNPGGIFVTLCARRFPSLAWIHERDERSLATRVLKAFAFKVKGYVNQVQSHTLFDAMIWPPKAQCCLLQQGYARGFFSLRKGGGWGGVELPYERYGSLIRDIPILFHMGVPSPPPPPPPAPSVSLHLRLTRALSINRSIDRSINILMSKCGSLALLSQFMVMLLLISRRFPLAKY